MPKVSVYLPDELAERVRDAKLPVSAICQAALGEALRQATLAVDPFVDPDAALPPDFEIEGVMVRHFGAAVHLAYESAARRGGHGGDGGPLRGLLDEGENLMLQTLQAIDVDPARLTAPPLDQLDTARQPLAAGATPVLSARARRVARQTDDEAKRRGQPVNLAHLLFALLDDVDGGAGQILRRCRARHGHGPPALPP